MAQAASIHTLEKGLRTSDFVMIPIGGAGPVHACQVARKMGMRHVICPMGAGVASAFGFLASPMSFEFVQASVEALDELDLAATRKLFDELEARGHALLQGSGLDRSEFSVRLGCAMRYIGQGYEVDFPMPEGVFETGDKSRLLNAFEDAYRSLYGRVESGMPTEVVSWRVVVASPYPDVTPAKGNGRAGDVSEARKGSRRIFDGDSHSFVEVPVYDRYKLSAGMTAQGPAVVEERESTLVVPARSTISIDAFRNLIVTFDEQEG
jgi:N-methylhydantoinase A